MKKGFSIFEREREAIFEGGELCWKEDEKTEHEEERKFDSKEKGIGAVLIS